MSDDDLNYADMRERVEQRVRKRAEFLLHLAIFIPVNLFIWVVVVLGSRALDLSAWVLLIPIFITLAWTAGLVAHGADTYLQTGALDKMREREMRREIALARLRRGLDDGDDSAIPGKRKREPAIRLSDDGELMASDNHNDDQDDNDPQNERSSSASRASRNP